MARLFVKAAACSDIGTKRSTNEDNYFLNGDYIKLYEDKKESSDFMSSRDCGVFAVFDGMGGQSKGDFASETAARTLNKYKEKILRDGTPKVAEYLDEANMKICDEMDRTSQRIGSTAVILVVNNNEAQIYNLGDSRGYYISKNHIYRMSRDHTVADQLYRMNMLTKEEAVTDVRKHRLTKHLGIYPNEMHLRPYASGSIKINNDDMFVLCSDGITNALSDREIKNIVQSCNGKCKRTAAALVERAINNNSDDNVTALVVSVVGSGIINNKKRMRHPHLYPFLLGVGISAIVFAFIVAFILAHFM